MKEVKWDFPVKKTSVAPVVKEPKETKKQLMFGKELIMDEDAHAYTFDGQFVPGVTTILKVIDKPALAGWYKKIVRDYWLEAVQSGRTDWAKIHKESWTADKKLSKAAADIGQNVHAYAEAVLKELPLPTLLTDEAKRGAEAFHKWLDAHKVKLLASERMVFSQEHYYAGTCDIIAEIDGKYCVGDFKTSSGIYPEMRFQTAAYQQAIQEEKGVKVDGRWIIRFDKKTGEFESKFFEDFELDFSGFRAALTLHKALQAIG